MESRQGSKSKKASSRALKSPSSSTTSSSKQLPDTSFDGLSSPGSSPVRGKPQYFYSESLPLDAERSKENVTVTVRFRPLSPREIRLGEEVAWYADGESIVRNEHNPSIAYAYDQVFGSTTTTLRVYDIAAQHVVSGAMGGINGKLYYPLGVIHILVLEAINICQGGNVYRRCRQGDQRSPGIIPLAVKDAFSIIQETPSREFLLRVSYLEIYNEVVNDLLNPAGQNLRIREDAQGAFVEGIKEEVVLSPAHALSLIAAGEVMVLFLTNLHYTTRQLRAAPVVKIVKARLLPCRSWYTYSASSTFNLIDLAGSESSKAETTGVRRKEGSYINKSLLTLGTSSFYLSVAKHSDFSLARFRVISKLTDGNATHVPYRDSKLTRLLQSSLSGHGRVSVICTVTPSSSNSEETHNTLKFAHRAKHIEIQAAQNKIIDEKSLIKKYQNEIRCLKEELGQLKRGIVTVPQLKDTGEDDIYLLKQKKSQGRASELTQAKIGTRKLEEQPKMEKAMETANSTIRHTMRLLEDGQVKLQSRLEQEEEAKAALLSRIQRLTKLILVSTKTSQSSRFPNRPVPRRRHSFGEEELAYLPYRRRDLILDDQNIDLHASLDGNGDTEDDTLKEGKRTRKNGLLNWLKLRKRDSSLGALGSTSDKSSGVKSTSTPSTPHAESVNLHMDSIPSYSLLTESTLSTDLLSEARQDGPAPEDSFLEQETPLTSIKTIDQIDLLREQQKILFGEVALHSSALKRLSEQASRNSKKEHIHVEIIKLNDEIKRKNEQIAFLEKRISDSVTSSHDKMNRVEASQSLTELMAQLNEKSFELEVKVADNRVIQEQLNQKICECEGLQETIASLEQQLSDALDLRTSSPEISHVQCYPETKIVQRELCMDEENMLVKDTNEGLLLQAQATEIGELKNKVAELTESKQQLELRNQKLAEESSYAKGLASAAAVELKALSEEVAKLMNHNERLAAELAAQKNSATMRRTSSATRNGHGRRDIHVKRQDQGVLSSDIKRELALSRERELSYEVALAEKGQREVELQKKIEESKQREANLENEVANMWVLVSKLKKSQGDENDVSESTRESGRADGFDSWSNPVQTKEFL
ncbi:unnamed protein product [Ilex paraguariensis]